MTLADGDPASGGGICGDDLGFATELAPISYESAGVLCCDGLGAAEAACVSACEYVSFFEADDRCADLGLELCSVGALAGGLDQGRKRVRKSQLQRLLSRSISTRFG